MEKKPIAYFFGPPCSHTAIGYLPVILPLVIPSRKMRLKFSQ